MPDENRFAGLSDAVEPDDEDESEESADAETSADSDARAAADPDRAGGPRRSPADRASGDSVDIANSADIVNSADGVDSVESDESSDEPTVAADASATRADVDDSPTAERPETADADSATISDSMDSSEIPDSVESSNIGDRLDGATDRDTGDGAGTDPKPDASSAIDDPAFEFEETEQHSVYVRPSVWQQFEDVKALVDARLRTEHDVRDLTGREFQDAVFRIATDHEDELVDAIVDARTDD